MAPSSGRARRLLVAIALAIGAGAGAAGCVSHSHRGFGTEVDLDRLRETIVVPEALRRRTTRLPPVAVSVTCLAAPPAAPAVTGVGVDAAAGEDDDVADDGLAFDTVVIEDELLRAIDATDVFEKTIRVAGDGDIHAAREEAYRNGASFLVEAIVDTPTLRRTERSLLVPSLLVWITAGFPNLWIHNHRYAFTAGLRLRVHAVATGDILPERPVPKAQVEEDLSFHERTSSVWPYLAGNYFPPIFLPCNEDKVARFLAASALRAPVAFMLEQLAEALAGDVYGFTSEASAGGGGPRIKVVYPPLGGRPVYLLSRKVRHAAVVEATGSEIVEVWVDGRRVFPARSPAGSIGRRRLAIEERIELDLGIGWLVEAVDASGRRSSCRVLPGAMKERKP